MEKVNVNIRKALSKDLNTLKEIEQEIIKFERPFDPNLKQDPIEYYDLLELIQREDAQVLVATIDGEIVGSGYALIKTGRIILNRSEYAFCNLVLFL